MNRAHGICQQTLKLTDRKMRSEPYLRRETFLLSHPLVDTLPEHKMNDEISLIYQTNKYNLVAVKTAVGLTERVNIPNIIQ